MPASCLPGGDVSIRDGNPPVHSFDSVKAPGSRLGAQSQILIVDDNSRMLETWRQVFGREGYTVVEELNAGQALERLRFHHVDLVLCDARMNREDEGLELLRAVKTLWPALPFILYTGWPEPADASLSAELGGDAYVSLPIAGDIALEMVQKALNKPRRDRHGEGRAGWADRLVCASEEMQALLSEIDQIRARDIAVLITGETGTGKELVARWIHAGSAYAKGPFVAVNCAGLPSTLADAMLFGHRKGAFTSADTAGIGLVEVANGGTLFLDEVGELPVETQAGLLRFLDTREYRRIGEAQVRRANARILAATNRRLRDEVQGGRFRKDLYFRLEAVVCHIPPIRTRPEDLQSFVERWRFRSSWRHGKSVVISVDAMALLRAHDWPGNFRELQHVLDRAELLSRGGEISVREIARALGDQPIEAKAARSVAQPPEGVERDRLRAALEEHHWKVAVAAKSLGVSRWTLWRRLRELGVRR